MYYLLRTQEEEEGEKKEEASISIDATSVHQKKYLTPLEFGDFNGMFIVCIMRDNIGLIARRVFARMNDFFLPFSLYFSLSSVVGMAAQ